MNEAYAAEAIYAEYSLRVIKMLRSLVLSNVGELIV